MNDEYLYRQARLYLEGKSLRQIAAQEGVSHVTIRHNLIVKLKDCNLPLYFLVISKINDNTPDSIDKKEVVERVLKVYHLSVDEGLPIEEIASKLDASPFTIYRDLAVRLARLHERSPKIVTKEMLETSTKTLSQRSLDCLIPKMATPPVKVPKNRLDRIITGEKEQYTFLAHCMLTFRITPKTMSAWLGLDENEFYTKLMAYNANLDLTFQYMTLYEIPNQEEAFQKFDSYYGSLIKAKMYNQKTLFASLLEMVGDKAYKEAKQRILTTGSVNNEDIGVVIRYILKYNFYPNTLAEHLGLRANTFAARVNQYLAAHPELIKQYEILVQTLPEISLKSGGRW